MFYNMKLKFLNKKNLQNQRLHLGQNSILMNMMKKVLDVTSTTTGALVVSGGAGIAKDVFFGNNCFLGNPLMGIMDNSNLPQYTQSIESKPVLSVPQPVLQMQQIPVAQPIIVMQPSAQQQMQQTTIINNNNGRNVNHCVYGLFTICTGGIGSICWIGACFGCCPQNF